MKPNVLFILIDCARFDRFGCYGSNKGITPVIDQVATQSALFERAYSPAGWTQPSVSSIFSGIYPSKHGQAHLSKKFTLITEVLNELGFQTYAISCSVFVNAKTGLDRGFKQMKYFNKRNFYKAMSPSSLTKALFLKRGHKYFTKLINEEGKKFITLSTKANKPFFVYLHHSVHFPYNTPRKWLKKICQIDSKKINKVKELLKKDVMNLYIYNLSDEQIEILNCLYDARFAYVDSILKELIQHLKELKIYDKTLLIISADHGDQLGENGYFDHKFTLTEPLIHVPLIIKFPGSLLNGSINGLCSTIDIYPTLLDILGYKDEKIEKELQGISLLKIANGQRKHDFVISERADTPGHVEEFKRKYPSFDIEPHNHRLISLVTEDNFKYVWSSKGRHQLYNLNDDPKEEKNLMGSGVDKEEFLRKQLRAWLDSFTPADDLQKPEFDDSMKRHLRALGYLE